MALILNQDAVNAATWLPLPNGAALLCVPATSALLNAAEAMANGVMVDLAASNEAVTRVGGHIIGVPDLSNEAEVDGMRQTLVLVSLMELAARDWRGILDEDRTPLKFRPSLIALLLSDPGVCRAIERHYLKPLHEVVAEGNVSGRSPSGTSESAGDEPIAKAAKLQAQTARPRVRRTVPTTSTRQ